METEAREKRQEIAELEVKCDSLETRLRRSEDAADSMEQQNVQLARAVHDLKSLSTQVVQENERLQESLQQTSEALRQTRENNKLLSHQLAASSDELETSQDHHAEASTQIRRLQIDLQASQAEVAELQRENGRLRDRQEASHGEATQWQTSAKQNERVIENLTAQIRGLQDEKARADLWLDKEKGRSAQLAETVEDLSKQLIDHNIQTVRERVRTSTGMNLSVSGHSPRDMSSSPLRRSPVPDASNRRLFTNHSHEL